MGGGGGGVVEVVMISGEDFEVSAEAGPSFEVVIMVRIDDKEVLQTPGHALEGNRIEARLNSAGLMQYMRWNAIV